MPFGQQQYVYDEAGHLIGEYDAAATMIEETVYLGDTPVAVLTQSVDTSGPTPVTSTNVYYVYADQINTPRVITQASDNQIVWRWDASDPFGMLPPDEDPSGLGGFTYNPRFPGQLYDSETNLHYNGYRDYDPQVGRYTESDPVGLSGGINTYGYVGANPIRNTDPRGLNPVAGATAGGEIGTAIFPGVGTVVGVIAGAGVGWWIADKVSGISLAKPKPGSKPKGCPTGTKPIDQIPGLDKDNIHGIKDGVGAGPRDWTGIAPNGDVITGDSKGEAVNHGPYNDYLP